MKNAKILITFIILCFNLPFNNTADAQSVLQEEGFSEEVVRIRDMNCSASGGCEFTSRIPPVCEKIDFASAEKEEDLVGCVVGTPDASKPYWKQDFDTEFNVRGYYCKNNGIEVFCHTPLLLDTPVCGTDIGTCETGNASPVVNFDEYRSIWNCTNEQKNQLCVFDLEDHLPICDTQSSHSDPFNLGSPIIIEQDCINGTPHSLAPDHYYCSNEYGTVRCDHEEEEPPISERNEPICGATYNTCDVGSVSWSDGFNIHYCENEGETIGCDYTPPSCDYENLTCEAPAIRMGSVRENSEYYEWDCQVENGNGTSWQHITTYRTCEQSKDDDGGLGDFEYVIAGCMGNCGRDIKHNGETFISSGLNAEFKEGTYLPQSINYTDINALQYVRKLTPSYSFKANSNGNIEAQRAADLIYSQCPSATELQGFYYRISGGDYFGFAVAKCSCEDSTNPNACSFGTQGVPFPSPEPSPDPCFVDPFAPECQDWQIN